MPTVAVLVSNGKRSKEWFRDKLGFEVKEDEDHWIVVAPRGSKTGIHLCESKELEPGNQGILFYADDADATCKELNRKASSSLDHSKRLSGMRRQGTPCSRIRMETSTG